MNKLTAASPEAQSADLVAGNIQQLKALFPELITEGPNGTAVNVDVLKALVGDQTVTDADEKYGLNWYGKRRARQLALTPSTGTLRPCPDESVDWDTTQNLMIEGDNLEVLKLLQKSYAGKVKLIYIDPPYNTGKDFVYPDNFQDNIKNYLELTGQVESGQKISSNTEASGRFHTDWLNMMYPRLKLARNLLTDDGVIFISIDDGEQDNLKKIGNEIFGEENIVAVVPRIAKRTSDKGTYFRPTKDYVMVWARNISSLPEFGINKIRDEADYDMVDSDGRKYKQSGASLFQPSLDSRPNQRYFIEAPDGSLIIPPGDVFPDEKKDGAKVKPESNNDKVWRWSVDTYMKQKNLLIFTKGSSRNPLLDENGMQSKWNVYPKVYFDDDVESTLHPEDVIYDFPNSQGTKELKALSVPFSFSKPTGLVKFLLQLIKEEGITVLDFFAGSSTTAHAVMQLNAEDNGNRRFIMVQLPEPTPEDSEAYMAGFKTIADISRKRIELAGEKIKADSPITTQELDTGFRVFKLDHSNIRAWNPDPADLEASLFDHQNHLLEDRPEADVLYELLLKLGLDLCVPIEKRIIAGREVHSVGGGVLIACLAEQITCEQVEPLAQGIIDWHKALAPAANTTCVFRDSAFENDVAKTNLTAILEQHGIQNVRSL